MAETERKLGEFGFAGDDHVVPFSVAPLDMRGRSVQLGQLLDQILGRHDYPEPVARLLAEAIVLTVLLGTSLKFEGKFILQTRSDGPVDMLVADFSTPKAVRAYARFDEERLAAAIAADAVSPEKLLGKGVLALTIDNQSDDFVQLLSRHWRITDATGRVEEVSGAGVVGEQPELNPGDSYQYTSGCPLTTPSGIMSGRYTMRNEHGETFDIAIPTFSLDIPDRTRTVN